LVIVTKDCTMKLTVVGHLCLDTIDTPSATGGTKAASPVDELGGIFYSIVTLAHLMENGDMLNPVFGVGDGEYERVMDTVATLPRVNPKGIYRFKGKTNQVYLSYDTNGAHRIECSNHISQPIPFAKIKPHLDADGVLVNMISGFDITLETLDHIRMEVRDQRTPVHFDFHSLTLGIDQDAKRFRRPLPDWRRWCFMMNAVQMSSEEAQGLTIERYSEDDLIHQLMTLMVNHLLITRGTEGLTLIEQHNKKLTRHDLPAVPAQVTVDPTGCGDVLGAAYLYFLLKTKEAKKAGVLASQIAALNASRTGTSALSAIPEFMTSPRSPSQKSTQE